MAMDRERPRGRKRRKVCTFCVDKVEHIDYKDAGAWRRCRWCGGAGSCSAQTGTGAA